MGETEKICAKCVRMSSMSASIGFSTRFQDDSPTGEVNGSAIHTMRVLTLMNRFNLRIIVTHNTSHMTTYHPII
jgi:hypothetical protein